MKLIQLEVSDLVVSEELSRSGSAKQFEERLKASIEEVGLAEPIKVAPLPTGRYVVVDGTMRLKAIAAIRRAKPEAFPTVPAYVMDYERRYELRFQTDIYQDLLPSQLAGLVEHLHKTEHIRKVDIARFIGVSPATLRNYTGLWRLLQRGGLFARVVELMDFDVIPSSNPYAWLRLTATGLQYVLEQDFSKGTEADSWIEQCILDARRGKFIHFPIKFVEATTDALPSEYYREGEEVRNVKRDLGLRRGAQAKHESPDNTENDNTRSETDSNPAPTERSSEGQDTPTRKSGCNFSLPHSEQNKPNIREGTNIVLTKSTLLEAHYGDDLEGFCTPERDPCVQPAEQTSSMTSYAPDTRSKIPEANEAVRYLSRVSRRSLDPVLRLAARSLQNYLQ